MRGDENSPHILLTTHEGNQHVFPLAMVEDLIEGRLKLSDVDDGDAIMRAILDEWLTFVKKQDEEE